MKPGPLRVLWLPHSLNPAYAGVRLRCLLPASALQRAGMQAVVTDALPPAGQGFDVAVVQGKWLLDAPSDADFDARADALAQLASQRTRIVVDSFDNYFLNEGRCPVRQRRLERYRLALAVADRFIVSSPGLVPLLAPELPGPAPIDVLGDPVEHSGSHRHYEAWLKRINPKRWLPSLQAARLRYAVRQQRASHVQLLWFGNHGSKYAVGGMAELEPLLPHLAAAHRVRPLHLRVVSNSRTRYETLLRGAEFSHSYEDWHRLHFAELLSEHDLVVLPNRLSQFTAAKSNNRLLLALAQGVPVMADPLPDYSPWQAHFAPAAWHRLPELLDELPLWRERAAAARPAVMARYSLDAIAQDWVALLKSAAPLRPVIRRDGPVSVLPLPVASVHSRF